MKLTIKKMNKFWALFEKTISRFEIIFGVFIISMVIWALNLQISTILEHSDYTRNDISFYKLIKKQYSVLFLGFLSFSSGILLLKNIKFGWILSVTTWWLFTIGNSINLSTNKYQNKSNFEYLIFVFITIIYLILTLCLTSKHFRTKYKANLNSWIIFWIITLVFIIEKLFNYKK